jgi:SAM-dependent methyltransferase
MAAAVLARDAPRPDLGARPLPPLVAAALRCPTCGERLDEVDASLRCASGHAFPARDGYLDFSAPPTDDDVARTLSSFGYEWTAFDEVQPEDEAYWRWYFQDVPLDALRGQLGLDAGCGKGRYTTFTARHLGATVALDGSDAVVSAVRNLAEHPALTVVKADVRDAPFADGSFGFVSCLGVLHHLPDPEAGFRALTRLLAPGGRILIYVYSRPTDHGVRSLGLGGAALLRRLTTRTPVRLLRLLSAPIAALLFAALVAPGRIGERRGIAALAGLPLRTYRRAPLRSLWLDTFDRLSAPLEARYTGDEVEGWFTRAGLTLDAVREDAGWFVLGRRPAP